MLKQWTNDAAHEAAVTMARYRRRFGALSPVDVWQKEVSTAVARGLTRADAIGAVRKDADLLAAYEHAAANAQRLVAIRAAVARTPGASVVGSQEQIDGSTVITIVVR